MFKYCLLLLLIPLYVNGQEFTNLKIADGIGDIGEELINADIDGDGDEDVLFAAVTFNNIYVLFNDNGTLSKTPIAVMKDLHLTNGYGAAMPFAVGDFDKDGTMEIAYYDNVTKSSTARLSIHKYTAGHFSVIKTLDTPDLFSTDLVAGDSNNDGILDLFFTCWQLYEYESNLAGEYTLKTLSTQDLSADKCHVVDLDGDSWIDLVIEYQYNKLAVYKNDFGSFQLTGSLDPQIDQIEKVLIADFTGEGSKDLIVKSRSGKSLAFFTQNTDQSFSYQSIATNNLPRWGIDLFDNNQDGQIDIVMNGYETSQYREGLLVLENDHGSFTESFYSYYLG
jgi:hypothetical protein